MKHLSEYIVPLKDRKEYLEYKSDHPDITPEEYVNHGLCKAMAAYDYHKIIYDFWQTGLYHNKHDIIRAIMLWSEGHLILNLVLKAFCQVTQNIEFYKEKYK